MNTKTKKISFHISSVIIIILFISFSSILGYNFYKFSNSSIKHINKLTDEFSDRTKDKVQDFLTNTNTNLKALASINTKNIFKNEIINISLMHEYLNDSKYLSSIYIANNNGQFLQVRRDPELSIRKIDYEKEILVDKWSYTDKKLNIIKEKTYKNTFKPQDRIWYKNTSKNKISISTPYIFESTKKLGITISFPVYKNNKRLFVVAADISLKSLNNFLEKQAKNLDSNIILISSNNAIISDTFLKNNKNISKSIYMPNINTITVKAAKKYIHKEKIKKVYDDITYIYNGKSFNINDNTKWHLIIVISEDKVLGNAKKTLYQTIFISIIILFIFMIIATRISKLISTPIRKLSKDIEELKDLNFDVKLKTTSSIREIREAQNSLILLKNGLNYFSKYMPSDLVKILIQQGKEAKVGGVEKELTIMFTDIEGFTTISETIDPKELTEQLSEYFELITRIINKYNGTIDKFIGDAVMAFWGAPLHINNCMEKSIKTAIEIQKELDILNAMWESQNKPILKTRIGIHHGKVLVGNIGSLSRMNYTIIGDNVNIAARLEGINKNYLTNIMFSQIINDNIKEKFTTKYVDSIKLKGKTQEISIYTIDSK